MGTKNLKGSVSIEHIESRIRLRWRFQKKRYSLNLFHFTKDNLLLAKKVAIIIEGDIQDGNFDYSLGKYKTKNLESHRNSLRDSS